MYYLKFFVTSLTKNRVTERRLGGFLVTTESGINATKEFLDKYDNIIEYGSQGTVCGYSTVTEAVGEFFRVQYIESNEYLSHLQYQPFVLVRFECLTEIFIDRMEMLNTKFENMAEKMPDHGKIIALICGRNAIIDKFEYFWMYYPEGKGLKFSEKYLNYRDYVYTKIGDKAEQDDCLFYVLEAKVGNFYIDKNSDLESIKWIYVDDLTKIVEG